MEIPLSFNEKKKSCRRYTTKCIFCGIECEGRPDRLPIHFLEKNCSSIPENLLTKYIIDYSASHAKRIEPK